MSRRPGIFVGLFIIIFIEFYSFIAVDIATKTSNPVFRTIVIILYILASILVWMIFLFFRKVDYSMFHPLFKSLFFAFLIGFLMAKIFMASLMFLDELRRFFSWTYKGLSNLKGGEIKKANHYRDISRSVFIGRSAILIGGLMIGGALWGTRNKYRYQVKKLRLKFSELPAAFKGLKIVQISDIHAGSFDNAEAVERGIETILAEKPDLIVFTGDLVNNKSSELKPYLELFQKLKAPMGVYSILGNHDYGDYAEWPSEAAKHQNLEDLKEMQAQMGWKLLMNEHILFERGEEKIALLGVENWGASLRFPKHGDLKKAYAGLGDQDVPFKILMTHDPSHWDAEVRKEFKDINLTLSGHTHGAQFGVRIPGFKWSPIQYLYKQWAGLYTAGNQSIYVNVGFGFLGYPGRVGILPEITVFELS